MNNTDFVYRPGKLHMAVSGNPGPSPDTNKINESLTRQNICLACYSEAKTPGEIAEMLGIAKAYIEFDLKWLVEKQFMRSDNGKYLTMFSVSDNDSYAKAANLFLENKENFSDVIIEKFISKQNKIKDIKFYGSDQPVEKLLWLLVYRFINFADYKVTQKENKYPMPERPIMPDGGQYFPLGFKQFDPGSSEEKFYNGKYKDIVSWCCNGAMEQHNIAGDIFHWMGLYKSGNHAPDIIFSSNPNDLPVRNVFYKALNKDFNTDELNDDEKAILSDIISYGWVSKKDDKVIHNFSVFTHEQNKALENIFAEIYGEMKDEIYRIFAEIEKLCRVNLPKHLDFYINYHIYMTFYRAIELTTGFAYYDGKLYDPKDDVECGLLTLQAITG